MKKAVTTISALVLLLCSSCHPFWLYTLNNPSYKAYVILAPEGDMEVLDAQDFSEKILASWINTGIPIFSDRELLVSPVLKVFSFYKNPHVSGANGSNLMYINYNSSAAASIAWAYLVPEYFDLEFLPAGYSLTDFWNMLDGYAATSEISYTDAVTIISALQETAYPLCGIMLPEDERVEVHRYQVFD